MSDPWVEQINLAQAKRDEGDLPAAKALYEKVLVGCKKQYGTDHPNVALVQNKLACLLYSQRDLAAAEPLFRRALAIGEKQHGLRVALDIENLAAVLWARGEHAEAELLFQRAIAIHKDPEYVARLEKQLATVRSRIAKILERGGEKSLKFAKSLHELAFDKYKEYDFAAAEPLCRRSLEIREKQLGPDHADVAEVAELTGLSARGEKKLQLQERPAVAAAAPPPAKRQKRSEEDDGAADRGEDDCVSTGSQSQEERDAELKRNAIAVDESDAEEGARPTRASALEDQLKELRVKGVEFDIAAALYWCKKNGADELSEIVEADMVDDFVASLSLTGKPLLPVKAGLLKKRLRAVVAGG
ncbi:hypothetical protein JL720_5091 [Aureococcus anophagefferens]|nr:hypothetical protein JL720_5091 [Aureococcus anophagefferens]